MKRRRLLLAYFILVCAGGGASSCAYHWGNPQRSLPGGYDRIAIPVFINQTFEPGVEAFFTGSLVEEVERNRLAKVVTKDESQVLVEGAVSKITYERGAELGGGSFGKLPSGTVLTKEYRIFVDVNLRLIRRSDGKVLWAGTFTGERRYPAPQITIPRLNSADALYNQSARMQNIRILAQDMMAKAHANMTENF